jgi:predicted nucleotidyltransferase
MERILRRITELIVRCCDPDEVSLFGSYAKGQQTPDSDLDILVVGDFRTAQGLRTELRELLSQYPIRIDLHLFTPEELAESARAPWSFPASLRGSLVHLYKRAERLY